MQYCNIAAILLRIAVIILQQYCRNIGSNIAAYCCYNIAAILQEHWLQYCRNIGCNIAAILLQCYNNALCCVDFLIQYSCKLSIASSLNKIAAVNSEIHYSKKKNREHFLYPKNWAIFKPLKLIEKSS